jgi:hypothetical protein
VSLCRGACNALDVSSRAAVRLLVILLVLLATGYAAASTAKDVRPFTYKFQVASVTLNATFTKGGAIATTELHLSSRPKRKGLSWWGKRNYSNANGSASALLRLAGSATYAGLDQACNVTVRLDSSRWHPIFASLLVTNARDPVVTRPTITASAGRFPLATIYPRRGGACENGALPWWEGGYAVRPLSVLRQAGLSFTARYSKTFDDGSALQWIVEMTIRKIEYRPIDCSHTPFC